MFNRALVERGQVDQPSFPDLWFTVWIALERLRLGDSNASIATLLDEVDAAYEAQGFAGMCSWLKRMRAFHDV